MSDDKKSGQTIKVNAAKIKQLRMAKGWSAGMFAQEAGLGKRTITNLEDPDYPGVSPLTLSMAAEVLGATTESLTMKEAQTEKTRITIVIETPHDTFDVRAMITFLKAVVAKFDIDMGIEPIEIRAGSTELVVEMPKESALKLRETFLQGKLEDLKVTSLREADPAEEMESVAVTARGGLDEVSHGPYLLVSRLSSAVSITLSAASYWLGLVSVPAVVAAVAGALTAYRARSGYWLAGTAIIAATSAVTAWAVRPAPRSYAATIEHVKQKGITTPIDLPGQGEFILTASAAQRQENENQVKRMLELADKLKTNPTEQDDAEFMELMNTLGKSKPERFNDKYTIPEGKQRLVLTVKGDEVFNKLVTVPPDTKYAFSVTQTKANRYEIKFTPPID